MRAARQQLFLEATDVRAYIFHRFLSGDGLPVPCEVTSHGSASARTSPHRPSPPWPPRTALESPSGQAPTAMKRKDVEERWLALVNAIMDPATDLVKARLPALIHQAIQHEFSSERPLALHASGAPALRFDTRAAQLAAEALMTTAHQRATLLVAQAIAARLAAGDGEKWFAAKRRQEERLQHEFDEYAREQREMAARRARVSRLRQGSIASPKRLAAAEALRARIAALRLPRIQ